MIQRITPLILTIVLFTPLAIRADDSRPDVLHQVGIDQRLHGQVPLELKFRDEQGREVQLGEYFDGKPIVLVLAYYRCRMLCTEVLNGLTSVLRSLPLEMGRQYRVLTVSFDPREGPELAAAKKASYVGSYGRPGAEAGWHFLTGDEAAIRQLADAVGFHYVYDQASDQFGHASGIMVLTPQGKIARYFFGIEFPSRDVRLALVEASNGKVGSPVDQLLLLCFHYDELTGRYTPSIMNMIRLGGAATLLLIGGFIGIAWRRERRAKCISTTEPEVAVP